MFIDDHVIFLALYLSEVIALRIYSIDFIKILSIYLVIVSHVTLYFLLQSPEDFGVLAARQLGQFGVVMFYMASGYFLLNNRHSDQFSYAYNKAKNVGIALIFWLSFYYVYDNLFIASFTEVEHHDFLAFINLDTCMSDASHLWFLFSIINLYFLLPLLRFAFVKTQQKMLTNVIAALFVIANVSLVEKVLNAALGIADVIHPALLMSSQITGLISFLLGGYLGLFFQPRHLSGRITGGMLLLAIASFTLLVVMTQRWGIDFFYGKTYNLFLQVSAVSVFVLLLCSRVGRLEKMISHVGSKTLGIYLVHNIFIMEINGGWIHHTLYPKLRFLSAYGYIFCYSLLAFIASYFLCCLLSQNRWLNKLISL